MDNITFLKCILILTVFNNAVSTENPHKHIETCPGYDDTVRYYDIKLTRTAVPLKETNYVCQQFKLPQIPEHHIIAFQPMIDNSQVMHHMLLFSCVLGTEHSHPHECGSFDSSFCGSWLQVWTRGLKEPITCMHPLAGFRINNRIIDSMALQIHWSNKNLTKDLYDSSGIRIWYKTNFRPFDAGNVQIGQDSLIIPPRQESVLQEGGCSQYCTESKLTQPIYLTRSNLHMHILGIHATLEHRRTGKLLKRIATDVHFDYQNPKIHYHSPIVKVKAGDELKLRCWYNTLNGTNLRNRTINFGEGADAEMCYAFITYFPKINNFDRCAQLGKTDTCNSNGIIEGCDIRHFLSNATFLWFPEILKRCHDNEICGDGCKGLLSNVVNSACMRGNISVFLENMSLSKMSMWRRMKPLIRKYNNCPPQSLTFGHADPD